MLGKDRLELAQSLGSVDVAHYPDNDHRRRLQNRHCVDHFFLVHLYKPPSINQALFLTLDCRLLHARPNREYSPGIAGKLQILLEPGFSTSRTTWVMPALKARKAVRWMGFFWSSLGKALTRPRIPLARRLGAKPIEPCRGAENFR
ncbi:hypothetical protein RvY_19360 [Ramazzottius varieornatus]|uniref:Uncharacterized protein n=1 Tax=Ramazzottius varieornatus TaxID=947166 RepID=A0A1D1WA60_RAMVA|nr:hypothetical protein RvY_19360 [Ramazzottius varieornatus]